MALITLDQILMPLKYNSGSGVLEFAADSQKSASLSNIVMSGSAQIVSTPTTTGSLTIQDIDTFGDSGSFFTMDLGDY